jgi:GTPases
MDLAPNSVGGRHRDDWNASAKVTGACAADRAWKGRRLQSGTCTIPSMSCASWRIPREPKLSIRWRKNCRSLLRPTTSAAAKPSPSKSPARINRWPRSFLTMSFRPPKGVTWKICSRARSSIGHNWFSTFLLSARAAGKADYKSSSRSCNIFCRVSLGCGITCRARLAGSGHAARVKRSWKSTAGACRNECAARARAGIGAENASHSATRAKTPSVAGRCSSRLYERGEIDFLNLLTGADVVAEDKLFATLDPTTRSFVLPNKQRVLLTDTVGFLRKLRTRWLSRSRRHWKKSAKLICSFILLI